MTMDLSVLSELMGRWKVNGRSKVRTCFRKVFAISHQLGALSHPLPTCRLIRCTPAIASGLSPRQCPLRLGDARNLLATPSAGCPANVSGVP